MKKMYIYGLQCPKSKNILYIGQSKDVNKRLLGHINQSYRDITQKDKWIKSLAVEGLKPEMVILEECTIKDVNQKEKEYISKYIEKNNLFNFSSIERIINNSNNQEYDIQSMRKIIRKQRKLWKENMDAIPYKIKKYKRECRIAS